MFPNKSNLLAILSLFFVVVSAYYYEDVPHPLKSVDTRAPKHFNKRNLYNMYNALKGTDNFVKSGDWRTWPIPMGTTEFTTAEFYGCTIVIVMGEKDLGIAHFRQYMQGGDLKECVLVQAGQTKEKILPELQKMMDEKDFACREKRALVIASENMSKPGVKLIRSMLDDELVEHARFFEYKATGGGWDDVSESPGSVGKVAVRVTRTNTSVRIEIFLMSDVVTYTIEWSAQGDITHEDWGNTAAVWPV